MTAAQGTPNRGKRGKSINLIKFEHFFDFSPKWSWGHLDRLKILSWGPLRFSTIENSILRTFIFSSIFDQHRPLAHFSLSPAILGARGQAGAQKVEHLSAKIQKFPRDVNFTMCFWRSHRCWLLHRWSVIRNSLIRNRGSQIDNSYDINCIVRLCLNNMSDARA